MPPSPHLPVKLVFRRAGKTGQRGGGGCGQRQQKKRLRDVACQGLLAGMDGVGKDPYTCPSCDSSHTSRRLVHATFAWSVKSRRAPSRQCRGAMVYDPTDYRHASYNGYTPHTPLAPTTPPYLRQSTSWRCFHRGSILDAKAASSSSFFLQTKPKQRCRLSNTLVVSMNTS